MEAAIEEAGKARMEIEARLSKARGGAGRGGAGRGGAGRGGESGAGKRSSTGRERAGMGMEGVALPSRGVSAAGRGQRPAQPVSLGVANAGWSWSKFATLRSNSCQSGRPPAPPRPQGPAVTMVRRHARGGDSGVSFGPALSTVTGNYVAAKRKVGGLYCAAPREPASHRAAVVCCGVAASAGRTERVPGWNRRCGCRSLHDSRCNLATSPAGFCIPPLKGSCTKLGSSP